MQTRQPIVAGMFYYMDPESLKEQLSEFFSKAETNPKYNLVVSPHAGYEYSGSAAAYAIGSLKPAKRFLILGPNHSGMGAEFAIMGEGAWKTPLGECKIDTLLAKELKKSNLLKEDLLSHQNEHSIEVQLPFLQYKFKQFSFVPVSILGIGYDDEFLEKCENLGKTIAEIMKKSPDLGMIASSDFSHYIPAELAKERDMLAIEKIRNLDLKGFFNTLRETDASICGYAPIAVLISAAKNLGLKAADLIKYTNSGERTGDYNSVVAYAAIGFC